MSDHNFEKQIQQKLDELKIPPADTVWSSVENQIRKDKRRRRGVVFFPLLLLIIGAGFYFIFQNSFSSTNNNTVSKSVSASSNPLNDDNASPKVKPADKQQEKLQDQLPNDVSTATKTPGSSKPEDELSRKNRNEELVADKEIIGKDVKGDKNVSSNAVRSGQGNLSRKTIVNDKITGANRDEKQQNNISTKVNIDRNMSTKNKLPVGKNQLERSKTKIEENQLEEPVIAKAQEVNTNTDSLKDRASVIKEADTKIDSAINTDLTATPNADSNSVAPAIPGNEKNIAAKKNKKSHWKWGLMASAGISNLNDGNFFDGIINGISGEKALVADVSPNAVSNNSGNPPPTPITYKPSAIEKGFSFSAGVFVQKNLSKRISLSTGLQYSYFSTHIRVGNRIDSFAMVQNAFGSLNVSQYYRPTPTTTEYTNRFHFIELPLSGHLQLNRSTSVPVFVNAGLSLSYLVSTNALHFDSQTGLYYKDNSLFNKLQSNLSAGFSIALWNKSKVPVHIGPQLQYGITNLMKQEVSAGKHFFYLGLNTKFFLKK